MDKPAQTLSWVLLFSISTAGWWGKAFMRGPVTPMLRWAPWRKPVIGPKAEPLLSPLNRAATTGELPLVLKRF
jgi:hypothetical protein